jgi:hypothetical protein
MQKYKDKIDMNLNLFDEDMGYIQMVIESTVGLQ